MHHVVDGLRLIAAVRNDGQGAYLHGLVGSIRRLDDGDVESAVFLSASLPSEKQASVAQLVLEVRCVAPGAVTRVGHIGLVAEDANRVRHRVTVGIGQIKLSGHVDQLVVPSIEDEVTRENHGVVDRDRHHDLPYRISGACHGANPKAQIDSALKRAVLISVLKERHAETKNR